MSDAMTAIHWLYDSAASQRRRQLAVDASRGLSISPEGARLHIKPDDTVETLRARLIGRLRGAVARDRGVARRG